jgi:hypothetical protein
MSDTSPILTLPYLIPSQAQKHVTHNEALRMLDAVVQLSVLGHTLTTPPSLPEVGDRYIVATGSSGAWSGHDGEIALFESDGWTFFTPRAGWRAELVTEQRSVVFDGTAWIVPVPVTQNLPGVGVNTTSDTTNKLSVASAASLFTHAGAGHQMKINKATATDTGSLLFQTGWSGRAEMGLAGDNNWSIKVSADGNTWVNALKFNAATGAASGAAVQASATDVTAGRLMRTDYGYSRGNVLGTVSQSSGTPTGAVLQRGSTANGEFVRMADGTQICTHKLNLLLNSYNNVTADWTFPKAFIGTPNVIQTASNSGSDYVNCGAGQFGLARQGTGTTMVGLTLTGIVTLNAGAEVRDVRVTAIGRWF